MTDIEYFYSKALEVGLKPSEVWNMSPLELRDTINSRFKQRQDELFNLSMLIRVAVASVLNPENKFPRSAAEAFGREEEQEEGDWHRSAEFMKELAAAHNSKYRKGA